MATYIITFLGLRPQLAEYNFQEEKITAEVFPNALMKVIDFDRMYVCVTALAKEQTFPILAKLNDDRIEAVDIEDGEDTTQMWKNFNTIVSKFKPQDKVIFDITHAARSIPFLTFLFSAYLKVAKQVEIIDVYYGALVFASPPQSSPLPSNQEPKSATVIKMGGFVSMLDWMSATERFLDLGDGNKLVELLRSLTEKIEDSPLKTTVETTASAIGRVSDALIYIRPMEVMESVAELKELIPEIESQGRDLPQLQPFLLLCEQIIERYKNLALNEPFRTENIKQNLQCQLEMMTWYQKNQQQVKSIVLGRELFVSTLAFWLRLDPFTKDDRKQSEYILNWQEKCEQKKEFRTNLEQFKSKQDRDKIKKCWRKTADLRNNYAHAGMNKNPKNIKDIQKEIDDESELPDSHPIG
jgi:CRISPR-associated (Cas) DxTHG family